MKNSLLIKILFFFTILLGLMQHKIHAQHIPFAGNKTLTWEHCIASYQALDGESEYAQLEESGSTDIGKPLHLFIINKDKVFYPELFDRNKTVVFINNDIHPGEPDGVDASLMLCRELLDKTNPLHQLLNHVIICIIPVYNVDGALNRGSFSRANQDGPEEYGFRGNARNLDLNRDFIKCDSENAKSFTKIFRTIRPHVFVDTHVSNGADYPYTMTLISTQSDKLGGAMGHFMRTHFTPSLFKRMEEKGDAMCPYVNTMGRTPESGLAEFLETPRFASGYTSLFNTFGFITETHMLKPFAQRVESTYHFLVSLLEYCRDEGTAIRDAKRHADLELLSQEEFALGWKLDTTRKELFNFSGYEAKQKSSSIGNGERTYYDHDSQFLNPVNFFNHYQPENIVTVPEYYIIPQAWREVIQRLRYNQVLMKQIQQDTLMLVDVFYIGNFETKDQPYEGHYAHQHTEVRKESLHIQFYKGDYIISTQQEAKRYLVETLEPQSDDGFFAWNFFDSILQQKEWFSDYVFEEKAEQLLLSDSRLKSDFEKAMLDDAELKNSHWMQLYWIYQRSPYYEKSAFRYPVYRL